jgi:aryl sulfotransferase
LTPAPVLAPARRAYRGSFTDPARWAVWTPRRGDILVCTPPKSGTTWTQTMLAMLLHGGPDLPAPVPVLSPWVDGDLGVPAGQVQAALEAQPGRRVVKTHTPADGFPVWDGVTVVAVYRHPLDVFFSLRKHTVNTADADPDHPMRWPLSQALQRFSDGVADPEDFDRDTLATLTTHYTETALSGRVPGLKLFHYAEFSNDGRGAVATLAEATGIDAGDALVDQVAEASSFGAMKSKAADYAPVGGTGFWKSDAAFFDSASSGKWEGELSAEEIAYYRDRMATLLPDKASRTWLETGAT